MFNETLEVPVRVVQIIRHLLDGGQFVMAVCAVREIYGMGIVPAKKLVDCIRADDYYTAIGKPVAICHISFSEDDVRYVLKHLYRR